MLKTNEQSNFFNYRNACISWIYLTIAVGNIGMAIIIYHSFNHFVLGRTSVMFGTIDNGAVGANLKREK